MKSFITLLILAGIVAVSGCKKNPEPTPAAQTPVDTSQIANAAKVAATEAQGKIESAAAGEQTTCPVMVGRAIDKNLFVEYNGKKVYFCCKGCITEFNKDPEKYVKLLPQFQQ
ncbi:MAG: YHS domain-containing protein [Sedimentisphaerales bacterium]|nr:YHS domain-containing protein [Sedimentisphaerales bacterium]